MNNTFEHELIYQPRIKSALDLKPETRYVVKLAGMTFSVVNLNRSQKVRFGLMDIPFDRFLRHKPEVFTISKRSR